MLDAAAVEQEIAACLDRGDLRGAATHVLRGHGPGLLGYLMALLRDEAMAREAFSQLGEEIWKSIGAFRRESACRTWAYKLAWHTASRLRRDARRRRTRPLADGEAAALVE